MRSKKTSPKDAKYRTLEEAALRATPREFREMLLSCADDEKAVAALDKAAHEHHGYLHHTDARDAKIKLLAAFYTGQLRREEPAAAQITQAPAPAVYTVTQITPQEDAAAQLQRIFAAALAAGRPRTLPARAPRQLPPGRQP